MAAAVYTMMKELVRGEDLRWGTFMSQAFAYGFRTLAANPQIQPTMLDLERLFFDCDWRRTLLPQVTDPFLRSYWGNQVDRTSTRQFELTFGGALRRAARGRQAERPQRNANTREATPGNQTATSTPGERAGAVGRSGSRPAQRARNPRTRWSIAFG